MCKKVGSPRVKLLYDIYHMQDEKGDVIATIRENIEYIAHFHTGGVPGRNEIDETQELYYPAVMKAIVDLKFDGYVAHEYNPSTRTRGVADEVGGDLRRVRLPRARARGSCVGARYISPGRLP